MYKSTTKTVQTSNYSRAFTCPLIAEETLQLVENAATNTERSIPVSNLMGRAEGETNTTSYENRIGTATKVTEYCTRVLPQPKPNSSSTTPPDVQSSELFRIGSGWAHRLWPFLLLLFSFSCTSVRPFVDSYFSHALVHFMYNLSWSITQYISGYKVGQGDVKAQD